MSSFGFTKVFSGKNGEKCRFGVLGEYGCGTIVVWSTRRVPPRKESGHVLLTVVILGKKMSSPFPKAFY
jgi:hypothetical protein